VYILDGKPLALDRAFTYGGISYPVNWLRLSSEAEREAIGITWVPSPHPNYDQRFYWGYDQDGNLIPKDHDELKTLWISNTDRAANTCLSPTDWMIVRQVDNGTVVPSGVTAWRQDVRNACEAKVTTIMLTTDTPGLAEYITYVSPSGGAPTDYNYWPTQSDEA
jgi:hypothetical protein